MAQIGFENLQQLFPSADDIPEAARLGHLEVRDDPTRSIRPGLFTSLPRTMLRGRFAGER